MIRFLAAEKDERKIQEGFYSVISVVFFAGLILSLTVFLLADSFAITILKDISAAPLIKIASVVILLQALDLASLEFFRAFGRMKKYSGLMLLQTFAEVGLVAYFVFAGFGLFGAVVSLLIFRWFLLQCWAGSQVQATVILLDFFHLRRWSASTPQLIISVLLSAFSAHLYRSYYSQQFLSCMKKGKSKR